MKHSRCSSCGGEDLYVSPESAAANGLLGPNLLPKLGPGRFRIVVCKDCGLTQMFASMLDRQALGGAGWERLADGLSSRPLGLDEAG